MSHKHQRTLSQFFSHPIPMNIKWSDVVKMFASYGADVEVVHGGREKISINGEESTFHIPHGKVLDSKDEVVAIRHFLERAGLAPDR